MKSKFKPAALFDAAGNVSKRWYVEYYYLDPSTDKYQRFRDYGGFNRIKDPIKRRTAFITLLQEINSRLISGWSPLLEERSSEEANDFDKPLINWLDDILISKGAFQKHNAQRTMRYHFNGFKNFICKNGLIEYRPHQIEKRHISAFLNSLLTDGKSNRTRNNYFIDINAAFNYLINEADVIQKNPCKGIPFIPARSETHKTYTQRQAENISDWFREYNPYMANFCRFIIYTFFRPQEVMSLRVGDIDLEKYQITIPAEFVKQGVPQKKPIIAAFKPYIDEMELNKFPSDWYLFSYGDTVGPSKPNYSYFRRRFKAMKVQMGFEKEHTMYGLRHTFVCMLVENNTPWIDIMRLTGHSTMSSFEKYLRDIKAMPARDISDKYTIKF